jgi:adhesin HecA-like repeat protein
MKYIRAKNIRNTPVTLIQTAVVAGAAAGDVTVTGIKLDDKICGVIVLDRNATAANITLAALTSEFKVTAADTINNTGGTSSSGDALLVIWQTSTV